MNPPQASTNQLRQISSNILDGGSSVLRRPTAEKSNVELTTALRANFSASQQVALSSLPSSPSLKPQRTPPFRAWTTRHGDDLYIPTLDFAQSGLREERPQYDITVKLFYLPNVAPALRSGQTREAIDLVLRELHVASIDLLIVSFPGISFDADDEDEGGSDTELDGVPGAHGDASLTPPPSSSSDDCDGSASVEDMSSLLSTWRTLESLHDEGILRALGVAEFGTQRLMRFLPQTRVRPRVNQINVRDCCVVPRGMILFAKAQNIELLTHNDCTNILPRGTLRDILGPGENGAGVLAESKAKEHCDGDGNGLPGEVEPQWVVKYTAVIKDRGVIENKGYFAVAYLKD